MQNGDWFVQYYFRDPENPRKWTAFKERQGINYIKDFDAKEREIEILRLDVVNWLSAGNSPYDEETAVVSQIKEKETQIEKSKTRTTGWSLHKAIAEYRQYITIQGHSQNTVRSYYKYLKAFEAWLTVKNLSHQRLPLFPKWI